ncbi:uncharacterized protein V1516DRAFT_666074 [Lipomyces oligophaga]|uniref:uncharacterized protein n=1 Tax=Lipomyces oligophaga TaxID=45792 RepID=UPI0034CE1854
MDYTNFDIGSVHRPDRMAARKSNNRFMKVSALVLMAGTAGYLYMKSQRQQGKNMDMKNGMKARPLNKSMEETMNKSHVEAGRDVGVW